MNEARYLKIKKSIEHLSTDEAIKDLEERIFYVQMADYIDFEFVDICKQIIKELEADGCRKVV